MNWVLRLFAMKSVSHVVFRTTWLTLVIAALVTIAGNRTTYYLYPQYHPEIAFTLAAYAFGAAILFAAPLLFGFHFMAFKVITINRELADLAARDPLTGLFNRRSFAEAFEMLMRKSRRQNLYTCALLMDVDHFKSINDQHGHDAGDRVLVQLGSMLDGHSGASSNVARLGGEEFGILKQVETIEEARQFAEKVRAAVEQISVWYNGECLKITVSIGLHLIEDHEKLAVVLMQADAALYAAKRNGRNRLEESTKGRPGRVTISAPNLVPSASGLQNAIGGEETVKPHQQKLTAPIATN